MVEYDFKCILLGDTFTSRDVTIKNKDTGEFVDLTGYQINCEFRYKDKKGPLLKRIEVGDGIVLSSPLNGTFTIEQFDVNWASGVVYYDFEFIAPNGVKTTYFGGKLNVIQDVTQNM